MPDDIAAALGRFQAFLDRYDPVSTIDEASGFTAADGLLLAAELELAEKARSTPDEFTDE